MPLLSADERDKGEIKLWRVRSPDGVQDWVEATTAVRAAQRLCLLDKGEYDFGDEDDYEVAEADPAEVAKWLRGAARDAAKEACDRVCKLRDDLVPSTWTRLLLSWNGLPRTVINAWPKPDEVAGDIVTIRGGDNYTIQIHVAKEGDGDV